MLSIGVNIFFRILLITFLICFVGVAGILAWKADNTNSIQDAAMLLSFCNTTYHVATVARAENREPHRMISEDEAYCLQQGVPRDVVSQQSPQQ